MKQKLTYLFLLMALLGLGSCRDKKDQVAPGPNLGNSHCRLTGQVYSYPNSTSFVRELGYNAQQQLVQVTDHYNFSPATKAFYTLQYNGQGQVQKVDRLNEQNTLMEFYSYEHNAAGLISRYHVFNKLRSPGMPPQPYAYSELEYNGQKQLVTLRTFLIQASGPVPQSTTTFVYDGRGNVVSTQEYRVLSFNASGGPTQDIVIKSQYTYDDKVNFNKENLGLVYVPTNPTLPILPSLSNNNVVTAKQETTTEGTVYGPGSYNLGPFNFNRTVTNEYNDKNRVVKTTQQNGVFSTNAFICQ